MTPEARKLITDRYLGWSELWGLSLAFAVTQSVEKSERVVADAIVALIAADVEQEAQAMARARMGRPDRESHPDNSGARRIQVSATRFAGAIWELALAQAFRGFGADTFFRMPAIARAIVVLKAKAQFSRGQIAETLRTDLRQVDNHLENAQLLFSDGRSWLETSPGLIVEGSKWMPECPQWNATAPRSETNGRAEGVRAAGAERDLQWVFAQYVGNDLDSEANQRLHSHLVVCTACRTSFGRFKKQYVDWTGSIPAIESDPELRKHLTKVTRMAFKMRRGAPPRALPGLRKLLRDSQIQAMVAGAALVMVFQIFVHHHLGLPRVPGFAKRAFHAIAWTLTPHHDKSGR